MKNIIRYAVVCVITLAACIVTNSDLMIFLLAMELLLPVFLYWQVRYLSGRLYVELNPSGMIDKGEDAGEVIRISNGSRLPVSYAVLELAVEDAFDGTQELYEMGCMIDAEASTEVGIKLKADYAGMLILRPKELRVSDYLHLFSKRAALSDVCSRIVVRPDVFAVGMADNTVYGGKRADGSRTLSSAAGDDASEILDTRTYQEGDMLHQIHWKLSAKMDELLVKVYSASADRAVCICLDWYRKNDADWSHEQFDKLMTIMTSVSLFMTAYQIRHTVLWCEAQSEKLCSKEISSRADVYGIVGALSQIPVSDDREKCARMTAMMEAYAENASCLRLDTELCLFWNGAYIASFAGKDLEQALRQLRIS